MVIILTSSSGSFSSCFVFRYPNVINKKVWSETLNDWVRFNMTTAALKGIDNEGGIDNYILGLDERSVKVFCYSSSINSTICHRILIILLK